MQRERRGSDEEDLGESRNGSVVASSDERLDAIIEDDEDLNSDNEGEWDNYQEDPSYITISSFSPTDISVRIDSSTDNFYLDKDSASFDPVEEGLIPVGLLDIEDSEGDSLVFEDSTMPSATRQAAGMYQQFCDEISMWEADFNSFIPVEDGAGAVARIPEAEAQDAKERYDEIYELFKQIRSMNPNHAEHFPELLEKRNTLYRKKMQLLNAFKSQDVVPVQ